MGILLLLTAWANSEVLAESAFLDFQEALVLKRWERARTQLDSVEEPESSLMRVDYLHSRGEHDLAWNALRAITPAQLAGNQRDYFFFLRARVELQLKNDDLVRRNLEQFEGVKLPALFQLRLAEVRLEWLLQTKGKQALIQETLGELPRHRLRRLFRWKLTGRVADYGKSPRWADALHAFQLMEEEADALQAQGLLVEALLWQSKVLRKRDSDKAADLLERSLEILDSATGDTEPELDALLQALNRIQQDIPRRALNLKGRIFESTRPGRTQWQLAGQYGELPPRFDRTALLLKALEQAEKANDLGAAAWLAMALGNRMFSRVGASERGEFMTRGRKHIEALGWEYPGRGPFSDASRQALEDYELNSADLTSKLPLANQLSLSQQRNQIMALVFADRYDELRPSLSAFLDKLEQELDSLKPGRALAHLTTLASAGISTSREWDPDMLSYTGLKEPLPFQEFFVDTLKRRTTLMQKLKWQIGGSTRTLGNWEGEFLLLLDRHSEARRIFLEVEARARELGQSTLVLQALNSYHVSLARTGELESDRDSTDRYIQELQAQELTGSFADVRAMLPAVEVLLMTGQFPRAVSLLERLIESAQGDQKRLEPMSYSSVLLYRALGGRLAGEGLKETIGRLESAAELAKNSGVYGTAVYNRYRAALLLESGASADKDPMDKNSRLQLDVAQALAQGEDTSEFRKARLAGLERFFNRHPEWITKTRAMQRVRTEVQNRERPLSVNETFLEALRFRNPIAATEHRLSNGRRRVVPPAEFLAYLGELVKTSQGDSALKLPLNLERLAKLQASLPDKAVIVHPLLLERRFVKLEVRRDSLLVDEFFLNGELFRAQLMAWSALASQPNSKLSAVDLATERLRPVMWDPGLDEASMIWLLLPRPLDGLPWLLLSSPESDVRWTDGKVGAPAKAELEDIVLVGASPELSGSRQELQSLGLAFPQARTWAPESGLAGFSQLALESCVLHISGHGHGLTSKGGGRLDLGPIEVTVDDLFSLRLPKHPLVVLATCDGGSGLQADTGRSFNLTTPFRAAGASAVLASIWALDDRYAAEFFPVFYRLLQENAEPWRALRQLRNEARSSGQHPYYWAGLFLVESMP